MRISDWSSDVCSSDLAGSRRGRMTQDIYPVPAEWQARAKVDANAYAETYARSLSDPEAYWLEQAQRLDWVQMPSFADESSFAEHDFGVRWFGDEIGRSSGREGWCQYV